MQYGCIGERLPHSFSKEIHARLADYDYRLCELTPAELPEFLRSRDFLGVNVTIPYKQAVMPYLTQISDEAAAIGAVNTIVNRDGELTGYNTDVFGLEALLRRAGVELRNKKVVILGTGGTSRTAAYLAGKSGAAEVIRVSRTAKDGAVSYEELFSSHTDAQVILNATPCGMYPHAEGRAAELSRFPALTGVADAVYNPLRTNLVLDAAARGIPSAGGLYMLVAQAAAAYGYFTGRNAPEEKTESIYRALLLEKENVVLTGMPGSGKSTVGRMLSSILDRPFFDTDEETERRTGRKIPQIIREDGEDAFRREETETIRALASRNGAVVATGGGAVLKNENLRLLRQNGRLVFLDRDPALLVPTEDRPLSSNREALFARYRERIGIYRACADVIVPADAGPEEVTKEVLGRITK